MTLIEPDMNLRMPDISTTVETLKNGSAKRKHSFSYCT